MLATIVVLPYNIDHALAQDWQPYPSIIVGVPKDHSLGVSGIADHLEVSHTPEWGKFSVECVRKVCCKNSFLILYFSVVGIEFINKSCDSSLHVIVCGECALSTPQTCSQEDEQGKGAERVGSIH